MSALILALIIVGLVLAGIELFMAGFRSLLCWAVVAIAVALLLSGLHVA
jgi:hypothetical protein